MVTVEAPSLLQQAESHIAQAQFALAEEIYRRLLFQHPANVELCNKLGWVLRKQAKWVEALLAFRACTALAPQFAGGHANLALILLQLGAYEEGFREYEYRLLDVPDLIPKLPFTPWRGEAVAGKRLLITAEQGLGDSIQFCRYLPLLAMAGGVVDVLVASSLQRLFTSLDGVREVMSELHTTEDAYDYHCSMMSLPHYCQTRLATIPHAIPYLTAPAETQKSWQKRLDALIPKTPQDRVPRIGLLWSGSPANDVDFRRSLPFSALAPLWAVPDINWVCLQKDDTANHWRSLSTRESTTGRANRYINLMAEVHDFADTAALVKALDLIISVDTSVAHLAGALGKTVWVIHRYDLCWRWLQGQSPSPWYPTSRHFRQHRPLDWSGVMEDVLQALRRWHQDFMHRDFMRPD